MSSSGGGAQSPIVRIDFVQAFAVASIGEGLYATRNKKWGDGPQIRVLTAAQSSLQEESVDSLL